VGLCPGAGSAYRGVLRGKRGSVQDELNWAGAAAFGAVIVVLGVVANTRWGAHVRRRWNGFVSRFGDRWRDEQ
jgi:hypothetical protein